MTSAGNDIVSFAATNFIRTKQPAFYNKILSGSEIAVYSRHYHNLLSFEVYVWLLWSVKEAVYKYVKRPNPDLIFSPTKIIVTQLHLAEIPLNDFGTEKMEGNSLKGESISRGTASCGGKTLYFGSFLFNDLVHSIVADTENFDDVYWGIQLTNAAGSAAQSKAVRDLLLSKLNKAVGRNDLKVIKSPHDIPLVTSSNLHFKLPVSLSHHGLFIAYSFSMPDSIYQLPGKIK